MGQKMLSEWIAGEGNVRNVKDILTSIAHHELEIKKLQEILTKIQNEER